MSPLKSIKKLLMKKNIKYLGVSVDSSLSWKYQIPGDPKFDNHTQGLMKKSCAYKWFHS